MVENGIREIIEKYRDALSGRFSVKRVYIFGSYASSRHNEESDIDVAIVLNGEFSYEDELEAMKMRRNFDLRIEPHLFSEEDFKNASPIVNEILQNGIEM